MSVQFLDANGVPLPAGIAATITGGATPITGTTDDTGSIPATLRSDTLYTAAFTGANAPTQTPSFYGNTAGAAVTTDSGAPLVIDSGSGTIVVLPAASGPPPTNPTAGTYTLVISPDPATVSLGETQQFTASILNSDDGSSTPVRPGPNVAWATNAGTITPAGLYSPAGGAIGSGGNVPWFVSCTVSDFVPA